MQGKTIYKLFLVFYVFVCFLSFWFFFSPPEIVRASELFRYNWLEDLVKFLIRGLVILIGVNLLYFIFKKNNNKVNNTTVKNNGKLPISRQINIRSGSEIKDKVLWLGWFLVNFIFICLFVPFWQIMQEDLNTTPSLAQGWTAGFTSLFFIIFIILDLLSLALIRQKKHITSYLVLTVHMVFTVFIAGISFEVIKERFNIAYPIIFIASLISIFLLRREFKK